MATTTVVSNESENLRREQLAELTSENEAGWEREFLPGSLGCHELLDRTNLVGDLVESQILEHPTCVLNPQWHELALQAVDALRALYQHVGADHVGHDSSRNGNS